MRSRARSFTLPKWETWLPSTCYLIWVSISTKPDSSSDDGPDWNGAPALVLASDYGHLPAVRLLLERGADINNKNEFPLCDRSALLTACTRGHVEIVKLLAALGAKSEATVFQGTTNPLPECAELESPSFVEIITLLRDGGYDINRQDVNGRCALQHAATHGDVDLLLLLLDRGADVNARAHHEETLASVLDQAAFYGCLDTVKALLDHGAEIRHETRGCTALRSAAELGQIEVLRLLLERGASFEARETDRWTALHEAAACGRVGAVKLLIEAGFCIEAKSSKDGQTPLLEAVRRCRTSTVGVLLESGAILEARDDKGNTALHHVTFLINNEVRTAQGAISYPRLKLLQLLIDRGANIRGSNKAGESVLYWAIEPESMPSDDVSRDLAGARKAYPQGDVQAVKLLITLGADVNASNGEDGATALHKASHDWNVLMIETLLEAGADVNARKSDGKMPLFDAVELVHAAAERYRLEPRRRVFWWDAPIAIEVLLDAGADVNARRANGSTVLHRLAETVTNFDGSEEDRSILELLLRRGADVDARDESGETPGQVAERLEKWGIVELFKSSKAT